MGGKDRNYIDRRSVDRRCVYDIDVVNRVGERRSFQERRSPIERRQNWQRVSTFTSVCLDAIS